MQSLTSIFLPLGLRRWRRRFTLQARGIRKCALILLCMCVVGLMSYNHGTMYRQTPRGGEETFVYTKTHTQDGSICAYVAGKDRHVLENNLDRQTVYSGMVATSDIVPGGTQGLALMDMFSIRTDGKVEAKQTALDIPVRALVMPLQSPKVAGMLVKALDRFVMPVLESSGGNIWKQRSDVLHTTIFHLSGHENPVSVGQEGITKEIDAVSSLLKDAHSKQEATCSMHVFLERILVTQSGHIVACWQLMDGSEVEVAQFRKALKRIFPQARQTIAHDGIIHMTLARIVVFPKQKKDLLMNKLDEMNKEMCGLRVSFSQVWYVLEHDRLALALNGRHEIRETFGLPCIEVQNESH